MEAANHRDPILRLHDATATGNIEVLRSILRQKGQVDGVAADIDALNEVTGVNALHIAAQRGFAAGVQILLHHGANVNALDSTAIMPLHYAAREGHVNIARLLLEHGARIIKSSPTPLEFAIYFGQAAVASFLIRHKPRDDAETTAWTANLSHDDGGRTLLHLVAERGLTDVVAPLLERQRQLGNGKDEVQNLLDARDNDGRTALHHASSDSDRLGVALSLIENGATIEAKDNIGRTPLHHAASSGCIQLMEVFIEHGADISAKSDTEKDGGSTPLHLAASNCNRFNFVMQNYGRHRVEVVECLLRNDADIYAKDDVGRTSLYSAASSGNGFLVPSLLRAASQHRQVSHLTTDHPAIDVQSAFSFCAAKEKTKGFTALHEAVYRGNDAFVTTFLQYPGILTMANDGDNDNNNLVEVRDNLGRTALHLAVQRPGNLDVLLALLKHGRASVYARDNSGRNALHVAVAAATTNSASCRQHSFVTRQKILVLLKAGANVDDKTKKATTSADDHDGLTALQIAVLPMSGIPKKAKVKTNEGGRRSFGAVNRSHREKQRQQQLVLDVVSVLLEHGPAVLNIRDTMPATNPTNAAKVEITKTSIDRGMVCEIIRLLAWNGFSDTAATIYLAVME